MDYDAVRDFWDANAVGRTVFSGGNFLDEEAARFRHDCELLAFRRLVDVAGKDMLELGCGSGRWGLSLAPDLAHYHGVDLSQAQIDLARAALPGSAQLTCCDVRQFRAEQRFDIVYLGGVTQYLEDEALIELLRNARAMVAPGGLLISRDSVQQSGPTRVMKRAGYECIYRQRTEFIALMQGVLGAGDQPLLLTRELDGYGTPLGYPLEAAKMLLGRRFPRPIARLYYPIARRFSWLVQTRATRLYAWDLRHKFFVFRPEREVA